jgi:hypothetical protein
MVKYLSLGFRQKQIMKEKQIYFMNILFVEMKVFKIN